jgi:hypothetical protein
MTRTKTLGAAAVATMAALSPLQAADTTMQAVPGQPFCLSAGALHATVALELRGDAEGANQVDGCYVFTTPQTIDVIQRFPNELENIRVVKVRIASSKGTMYGYTMEIGKKN